ncbi:MAG: hypothetical protein ACJ73E_15950 [Mycobacteriales bacterium]
MSWPDAVRGLVPIPAPHAEPSMPVADVQAALRCSPAEVARLLDAGFPLHAVDGGLLADPRDVFNLAIASGSGRTIAEVSTAFALRFAAGGACWRGERRWRLELELQCPQDGGAWLVWPLAGDPAGTAAPLDLADAGRYTGVQVAAGDAGRLRSPELRRTVADALRRRPRYVRVPVQLSLDADWMARHDLVDCISGTSALGRAFGERGHRVRYRSGWLAGPVASEHSWLEVFDDDGRWKSVDLAFHVLARRLLGARVHPEVFLGSRPDRLLRTDCPFAEPLAAHLRCTAGIDCRTVATASAE